MSDRTSNAMECLEGRLLLAQTPSLRSEALGRAFDLDERQALLARLSNLPSKTHKSLANLLKSRDTAAFDAGLLAYMRSRTSAKFFFQPQDADAIADYVIANSSASFQITSATDITDRRLFPEQGSNDSYTVRMPKDINWSDASKSSNPEFVHSLNRMDWWPDLAQAYRYTGDAKYLNEFRYELADWSQENPTFRLPDKASLSTTYAFTVSIRVENWVMAYFSVLGSDAWSAADNSLMLYKLAQQGDVLAQFGRTAGDFSNNRTVSIGRAEMYLGVMLPEMDNSATWEANGRGILYNSIDAQFYSDGTHREQSPGYAILTIDQLLEARRLDALNGNAWNGARQRTLTNAVDALWQQLSPNGNRPAIGDTVRVGTASLFLKAGLTLNQTRWPEAKPRPRDVWVFGGPAVNPYRNNPASPAVGDRGKTYSLTASGNYVLRSGSDTAARQINFDAGPKGGGHGHSDLLSFEFFGYGRPLIADPGAYIYDNSDQRQWIMSTKAHNTIAVRNLNHGSIDDAGAGIEVTAPRAVAGGTMISAGHQGYFFVSGTPTVSRALWYDHNNTMVIVDFVESTRKQDFEQGFMVQNQNTARDLASGLVYTRNASGGNVRIQSLLRPGQIASVQTDGIFTSNRSPPNHVEPASRYSVRQSGTTYTVFATIITAHNGTSARAAATASWVTVPSKRGQAAVLNVNGTNITFNPPEFDRLNAQAESAGTDNDIAFDASGRLHMVYFDRNDRNLKYAVRAANGVWSSVVTIDKDTDAGYTPSLAIDEAGRPGVAYQDARNGDLRYAYFSPITNAWTVAKVDVKGSTGGYPSLVFNRNNSPSIAYYNRTHGDLRLAQSDTRGWLIETIDSKGDVGRFPSLQLNPNQPKSSRFAVAYEDTTTGHFKYAVQSGSSYAYQVVDSNTTEGGGYVSMKFYDSGDSDSSRYKPAMTYYDAARGQLRYAYDKDDGDFAVSVIAAKKRQGLYSKLSIENNKPRVFFFDGTNNRAELLIGTRIAGGKWSMVDLGDGGRNIHYALYKGSYAFSSLDERTGTLSVGSIVI